MIYEFKSRATGNLVMTQDVAERILQIIGKTPGPTGIITVEQMPAALAALRAAVAADKKARAGSDTAGDDDKSNGDDEGRDAVGLSQRAFPFIEMLERAQAGDREITWGV